MKYNIIIKAPPKAKITLVQVHKFNRIFNDKSGKIRIQVYEHEGFFYLVHKGKITTFSDYNECFLEAKKLSETSK